MVWLWLEVLETEGAIFSEFNWALSPSIVNCFFLVDCSVEGCLKNQNQQNTHKESLPEDHPWMHEYKVSLDGGEAIQSAHQIFGINRWG